MRIEKTVFISYRRANAPWALALYHALTPRGFDVFMDYQGLASGDFEQAILENIKSRAHFIIVLTPSSLERCHQPGDWFRREIETAMDCRRNIVPVMLDNFDFGASTVARQLTGHLALLEGYSGLTMPAEYFGAALERLCGKFLKVPLDAVSHPVSKNVREAIKTQQDAAAAAPEVTKEELTAQHWFELGYSATDPYEQIRFYTKAIQLDADLVMAYNNRGHTYAGNGDYNLAIADYIEAIRLDPELVLAYNNRGCSHVANGNYAAAIADYTQAIRLDPEDAVAHNNRGYIRAKEGEFYMALEDINEAIRLGHESVHVYDSRAFVRWQMGDYDSAISDCNIALKLHSDYATVYKTRGYAYMNKGNRKMAIADFQKFLDLVADAQYTDLAEVNEILRDLKNNL